MAVAFCLRRHTSIKHLLLMKQESKWLNLNL